MDSSHHGSKFTAFGMLGKIMASMGMTGRWHEYQKISSEEGGFGHDRAVLSSTLYNDVESDISLNETLRHGPLGQISAAKQSRKRFKSFCFCCEIKLFWKTCGIILGLVFLWQSFKFARWILTSSPSGLESMPQFSSSLGCAAAPYIYNSSVIDYRVPIGSDRADHAMDIRGSAFGTLVITRGLPSSSDIIYEITLRTDDEALLEDVTVVYPIGHEQGEKVEDSRFMIGTPFSLAGAPSCMRYDIKMYVPPALKKLHVAAHTATQVKFDPEANIKLEDFFVTLYALNANNVIIPATSIQADRMALEVYRGWIVGDASIVDSTKITTQRGDATANVHIFPTHTAGDSVSTAILDTTTGSGRTDIFYRNDKAYPHRPIRSTHISSRNGDLYLTYKDAEYNGHVDLTAQSYSARGLQGSMRHRSGDKEKMLPWVGNKNGGDELVIKSPRGWVGLYF